MGDTKNELKQNHKRITNEQESEALRRFPTDTRYQIIADKTTVKPVTTETNKENINHLADRHIGFLPAVTAQCFFPQRPLPPGVREWKAMHGKAALLIESGKIANRDKPGLFRQCNVPSGSLARVLFTYMIGSSVRNKSPVVNMGSSLRGFLNKLGFSVSGRRGHAITNAVEDMVAASFVIGTWDDNCVSTKYARMLDEVSFWLEPEDDDGITRLWRPEIVFSDAFYAQIQGRNIPVDMDHIKKFTRSPRRMDLYVWLSYRTLSITKPREVIQLKSLHPIFAPGIKDIRVFKQRFKQDLKIVLDVYPSFRAEVEGDMLILRRSSPPIQLKTVVSTSIKKT